MTEPELKPCPFCGYKYPRILEDVPDFAGATWKIYRIECSECYTLGPECRNKEMAIETWNRRAEPEKPKAKTIPLSSLKDSDYVWILTGRTGIYWKVEKAKKACPDWNVTAFLCEIDTPVINYDTFDQRIFDLVDDSEYQFYVGNDEDDYPYYNPETVKQMYDILMAGIREKGQFVKPTNIQVVKD